MVSGHTKRIIPIAKLDAPASAPVPSGQVIAVQPPLSLYVHFPWCLRKCPYCDFNSHQIDPAQLPHQAYLEALRADLESQLPSVWGRPVHSVFMGGGTPSLFPGRAIHDFLGWVRACLPLVPEAEITLEANPGSFETNRFAQFREAGVNRLSVGVQSFRDDKLKVLGRVHDGAQARLALTEARHIFDNLNIDLMIGLPGQSVAEALDDVQTALSFEPDHLSVYQLTLEPNTVFHKYPPERLPDDDTLDDIQTAVDALLAERGFTHYEISAYAKPGRQSVHNRNYWTFGDYLGIGAGAHGKLTLPDGMVRTEQSRVPERYLEKCASSRAAPTRRDLVAGDLVFEFALNAFRLRQGFPASLFTERTGLPFSELHAGIQQAQTKGLLHFDGTWIRPSELGLRFLNDLQAIFLVESSRPAGP